MSLLGYCKIVPSIVPTAGSVAACTAAEIDCTGFDRVCHIIALGASGGAGSTFDYQVQDAAATGMSGAANISGAALTQVLAAGADKVFAIDIPVNPARPFQKAVAAVGTATQANGAIAILYNGSGTYPKIAATQAVIL